MSSDLNFRILTGFVCESRLGIHSKATFAVLFWFLCSVRLQWKVQEWTVFDSNPGTTLGAKWGFFTALSEQWSSWKMHLCSPVTLTWWSHRCLADAKLSHTFMNWVWWPLICCRRKWSWVVQGDICGKTVIIIHPSSSVFIDCQHIRLNSFSFKQFDMKLVINSMCTWSPLGIKICEFIPWRILLNVEHKLLPFPVYNKPFT